MKALAQYRETYGRQAWAFVALSLFIVCDQVFVIALRTLSPAHNLLIDVCTWVPLVFWLSLLAWFVVLLAQVRSGHPAIWVANGRLFVVSPLHFSVALDDIASCQVVKTDGSRPRYRLRLRRRNGRQKRINIGFVADPEGLTEALRSLAPRERADGVTA